jgi:UDPglucose--hexose-1-phosphate uridylyltransferase
MKRGIRFERHVQKSTFHNPMRGNELDTQEIEIRRDPLTGHQSVFNPVLEDKVAVFFGPSDQALIDRLAQQSQPRCFLCGDTWKLATPTYPKEVVPDGRIQAGKAVLFPNLFPVAQVHAVVRVGDRHYVRLKDFDPGMIQEAFQVSTAFFKALSRAQPDVRYVTVNGNYLHPAGASIPHPHFQIVGGDLPFTYMESLFAHSRRYRKEQGTCYWSDLVETEKELEERYIAATGPVEWVASFSPRGTNEILGILPSRRDFLEMDGADLQGLAEGLSCVLKGYDSIGISTFNFAVYSGPLAGKDDALCCYLRIISRQNVYENYRTDDYFLQKLLSNELILTPPEALAKTIRGIMKKSG